VVKKIEIQGTLTCHSIRETILENPVVVFIITLIRKITPLSNEETQG